MGITKRDMLQYTNTAERLAELLKRDIQKDGTISNKTILVLNDFVIAANVIKDLIKELKEPNNKLN